MFTQRRNQRGFYYANYEGKQDAISPITGLPNGEKTRSYTAHVFAWGNIAPASGKQTVEMFGAALNYDTVIIPAVSTEPITEGARLWLESEPTQPHDHEVVRVSKGLNGVQIAAKRVQVSR